MKFKKVSHSTLFFLGIFLILGIAGSAQDFDTLMDDTKSGDRTAIDLPQPTPVNPPKAQPLVTFPIIGDWDPPSFESIFGWIKDFLERLFLPATGDLISLPGIPAPGKVPPRDDYPPWTTPPILASAPPPTPTGPASGETPWTTPPILGSGTAPGGTGAPIDETEFEAKGKKIIEELRAKGTRPGVGRGDSPAKREITGFPDWFAELQDLLCGSNGWKDEEETGRRLLADYATQWAEKNLSQPTFHSLPFFFQYLGCAENNDSAIAKYNSGLPRSGDFFGGKGQENWCAFASNKAYVEPIKKAGYKVNGSYAWANNTKYIKQMYASNPDACITVGDYVTTEKHVMTVVQVRGDKLLVVSGNAGGGSENYSGTVRLEEIPISKITIVKKHSDLSLENIKAHENDPDWLRSKGLSR